MATYNVRKTGSDSNTGLTAALAFLTIDKAANTVAAGDVVNVGAGVYRELVTMDTSGVSGNPITWIADIDGSLTGDAGLVVITANDVETATQRQNTLTQSGEDIQYNTWRHFTIIAGSDWGLRLIDIDTGEGMRFEDCHIMASIGETEPTVVQYDGTTAAAPTGDGVRFVRTLFSGPVQMGSGGNAVANIDIDLKFEACIFYGTIDDVDRGGVVWTGSETGGFGTGNVQLLGCTFFGIDAAITVRNGSTTTTGFTVDARNCRFLLCDNGVVKETSNDGALTSDFNIFAGCFRDHTNVTAGGNDISDSTPAGLTGGTGDLILRKKLGWSPYLPFEAMQFADQGPGSTYKAPGIGQADATLYDANSLDFYGNPRIMGLTAVPDMGAVEAFAKPAQETSTVRTGSFAISFTGFGYHEALIPVDAVPTTVSVFGRYNSSYGTPLPRMEVLGIAGVADQSDIMTGAADQWEQLSVTFTPTSAGVVRVRMWSQDEAGNAFFDDYRVTN